MTTLSREDFQQAVKLVCPHCRAGHQAVQRPDTKEWTHTQSTVQTPGGGQGWWHTLCWGDGLRRSTFNPDFVAGPE